MLFAGILLASLLAGSKVAKTLDKIQTRTKVIKTTNLIRKYGYPNNIAFIGSRIIILIIKVRMKINAVINRLSNPLIFATSLLDAPRALTFFLFGFYQITLFYYSTFF